MSIFLVWVAADESLFELLVKTLVSKMKVKIKKITMKTATFARK
jgi:hypothetical protein